MSKRLHTYLPITEWLPDYGKKDFSGDLVAGITVSVMLIPQGMAYALLAGVPPIYGLYASLVPLLVYPLFGSSRHLAVGIVAIDCLIISAGLSSLAAPMSEEYIGLVFVLALMVGAIQLLMGLFRMGFVVNLLSRPVIVGFTAAAAITIAFSQLSYILGFPVVPYPDIVRTLIEIAGSIDQVHGSSLLLGVTGIAIIFAARRWAPRIPAPLVAMVFGGLAVWAFGLHGQGVEIVGHVPSKMPSPRIPRLDVSTLIALMPTAVTLSFVQYMGVVSLGKIFASRHRYRIDANKELRALGAINLTGSLFQSTPVSGSFTRSSVSDQAGARTSLTNVVAAVIIGLTLLFLTPLFNLLPIPVLAAIIIAASVSMVDAREMRYLMKTKRADGLIALLTFLATLSIGIHLGVLIGIGLSVVAIMYRISRPHVAVLGNLPGSHSYRDLTHFANAKPIDNVLILRIDASYSFANADYVREVILSRVDEGEISYVVLDATSVNDLDTTAIAVLIGVVETLKKRGIEFYFGGMKVKVFNTCKGSDLYDVLGPSHFYLSTHRAVKHIRSLMAEND